MSEPNALARRLAAVAAVGEKPRTPKSETPKLVESRRPTPPESPVRRRKAPEATYESLFRRQTFYLDQALIDELEAYALRTGRNKSDVVRSAIRTEIQP